MEKKLTILHYFDNNLYQQLINKKNWKRKPAKAYSEV
ncbi:hypothetical protein NIES3275_41830 [Microchaete diplosiphon NIES-3275]|nr:hypothetical protein NIES3275_41830 [Microchaete diplosiphon NIES-3275]